MYINSLTAILLQNNDIFFSRTNKAAAESKKTGLTAKITLRLCGNSKETLIFAVPNIRG